MRISDRISDVCSSDLTAGQVRAKVSTGSRTAQDFRDRIERDGGSCSKVRLIAPTNPHPALRATFSRNTDVRRSFLQQGQRLDPEGLKSRYASTAARRAGKEGGSTCRSRRTHYP